LRCGCMLKATQVSLLNPRRVKQYAQSAGRRNKTDRLDAATIADFVCAMKPALWERVGVCR
jgi:transposase